jgi:predicted RNA binding protein YcfA (HicA-like mRNA interferase family)
MSKRDKLRRKLRNSPKGVKFADLETLLLRFGFKLMRIKGSHHIFRYDGEAGNAKLVIPVHGNNVKPEYVKAIIVSLDALFPEVEDSEDAEDDE